MNERTQQIDIVFDGPPGPEPGRFVEVETMEGASIRVGRWIDRGNGLWALRLTAVVRTDAPDEEYTCGAAYCDDPACKAHSYTPEMLERRARRHRPQGARQVFG